MWCIRKSFQRKANRTMGKWTEKGNRSSNGEIVSKVHSDNEVGDNFDSIYRESLETMYVTTVFHIRGEKSQLAAR